MTKKNNISDFGKCFREDELIKFVNNELNEAENALIEQHLICCEMCSDVVDALLMMDNTDELYNEQNILNKKIDKLIIGDKKRKALNQTTIRSIAAVALLLIISGTYFITQYLIEKKVIVEIRTADNTSTEKITGYKHAPLDGTELAERKTAKEESDERSNSNLVYRSPLHDFDNADKTISEEQATKILDSRTAELTINDLPLLPKSRTVKAGENRNQTNIKTETDRDETVKFVVEPTGASVNSSNASVLQKEPEINSGLFDLQEENTRDKKVTNLQLKESSDSQQIGEIREPVPTTNVASIDCIVLEQDINKNVIRDELAEEEVEPIAFATVEEKPVFPGGEAALHKFISENTHYPEIAKENNIKGRVYIQFIIDKCGNVTNVTIAKGVNPILDAEALRVVNMLPKWRPAKQGGKPVNVSYIVPIIFNLH